MGAYLLAEHVFVCVNDEHVVLLDLKQDRYWALEASKTAPLSGVVPGWPVQDAVVPEDGAADSQQIIDVLLEQGILDATMGKAATPVRVPTPLHELASADEYRSAPVGLGTTITFVRASLAAKISLRRGPFDKVIADFAERKRAAGGRSASLDLLRTRQLVETFFRLRIYFFSSKNECLFDSLSLLGFLARYGIYADWVFAVQARPFAAHCWVQHEDVVLNDTIEHVGGFTPIMVV